MKQEQTERNHVLEKAKFTTVSKGAADFRNWPSEVHSRFIHDSHTIYDLRFTIIYDFACAFVCAVKLTARHRCSCTIQSHNSQVTMPDSRLV